MLVLHLETSYNISKLHPYAVQHETWTSCIIRTGKMEGG